MCFFDSSELLDTNRDFSLGCLTEYISFSKKYVWWDVASPFMHAQMPIKVFYFGGEKTFTTSTRLAPMDNFILFFIIWIVHIL